MRQPPTIRLLPDGQRLHLQDGPIDLVLRAWGPELRVQRAYQAAVHAFAGVLDALCAELPALRRPAIATDAAPHGSALQGPVARAMAAAVAPFAREVFITPMAAVAGAVADHMLAVMAAGGGLDRAFVNNGGDIALHCAPGQCLTAGLVDRPDAPTLFDAVTVGAGEGIGGMATSGWRGRSYSLGIADAVTVLARSAASADAAATVIANAVDLPGHPAVRRVPADTLQPDTDLGERLVTRHVAPLHAADRDLALSGGIAQAEALLDRELIIGVALRLQGEVRTLGMFRHLASMQPHAIPSSLRSGPAAHA